MSGMIGETLYWAKMKDGGVEISPHTIIKQVNSNDHGPYYKLQGGHFRTVALYEVGKVLFLTKKEAVDALIKKLELSIEMGEEYILKEKEHLRKAKKIQTSKNFFL